jgi:photosystem II stability/assembly factor-like uncharacterized protein
MKKNISIFAFIVLIHWGLYGQNYAFTPASERINSYKQSKQLADESLVNNLRLKNIGPTVMSGRVTDIDVNPDDPSIYYVAYASGGVWRTDNNGQTFTPVFDNEACITIGDIAVNWKQNIIWVGTGENNSSRSSYAGTGIYKITCSSNTTNVIEYKGLDESHHIGRIILHPDNPDIVWVGVIGHLFTNHPQRGLYKTTDGGKTWKQTLFISEKTGIIDLIIDPKNPDVLYAASWQRERKAWHFQESGSESAIYKSTNAGETWTKITNGKNGFPQGHGVGRIGLAICPNNSSILYAFLDNNFERTTDAIETKKEQKISAALLKKISDKDFIELSNEDIDMYLQEYNFPKKYTAQLIKEMVKQKKIKPLALAEYVDDANSRLFNTKKIGAELYRSNDGGNTWQKTHHEYLEDLVYTYGYYFGQVKVDNYNCDEIYIPAFVLLKSENGGRTFKSINGKNQHVDHHALWINPKRKGHLINGNDGGINVSYDDGKNWIKCNSPAVGQFYTVNIDYDQPYNVYGGLQDNGVWYGPSNYEHGVDWHNTGSYPYKNILGGDGMQVMIDTRDNNIVYTGYQFGNYFRINKTTLETKYITPKHELGEKPLRFNWQTPIHLSLHQQDILYIGANKIYRSLNKGDDFTCISPDLTKGPKTGNVAFGTITTLHESPLKFGLIYSGSDDGWVYVTKDGGINWENISKGLPENYWVRRIIASYHHEARVYVALNGHTRDDFSSLLFVSDDYGKNWKRIGTNLPLEPINVIREDPVNENILYLGTDRHAYVSLNAGKEFMQLSKDLPSVPVHDIAIQPLAKEIVLATHGRSLYKGSIKEIQMLNKDIINSNIYLFSVDKIKYNKNWGNSWSVWEQAPEFDLLIPVYVNKACLITIKIYDENSDVLFSDVIEASKAGLIYYDYKLNINNNLLKQSESTRQNKYYPAKNNAYYLPPGKYYIECEVNSEKKQTNLIIEK